MQEWMHMVRRQVRLGGVVAAAGLAGLSCGGEDVAAPATGDLEVTTSTTGSEPDTDGYRITIDDGPAIAIGANASILREGLTAGEHTIRLAGTAQNCVLQGDNPRTVEIVAEASVRLDLVIDCTATTGTIRVSVATSGSPADPDGYVASLDGTEPGLPIATDGSVSFTGVAPGNHTVALTGLAANCRVDGEPSRGVSVAAGATSELSLAVSCAAPTGSLELSTATTGAPVDPDGYAVSVDGGAPQAIASNGTLRLDDLTLGNHLVLLSGIAANCHLDGANPRAVEVLAAPATVTFTLTCHGADALIAFTSNAFELLAVFVVNPDGSGLRSLTPEGEFESNPVWSPDGRRIAFIRDGDLWAMDADGGGRTSLAAGEEIGEHRWSPDGRMIAFVDSREENGDLVNDLWVMQADGTGRRKLAKAAFNFSWSHDGRLVYTSVADFGDVHLRIVNADGSGDVRLTNRAAFEPAWSPDGSRIAFVTLGARDIFLINPDGSGEVNLTRGRSDDEGPAWSPDGSRILFTLGPLDQPSKTQIAVMNPDGGDRAILTDHPGLDFEPAWSPDGSKIAFTRSEDTGDSEIYAMNADGSGLTDVTNRPDSRETTPDWNGRGGAVEMAGRQTRLASFYQRWLRANH